MKVKEIVSAYKTLGEAKVNNLEESEIIKILKARKAMRFIAEDFNEFLKEVQDKFKPENFEEIQFKLQNWAELSDEDKVKMTNILKEYESKINTVVKDELEKEIELELEKLNENSISKLLKNNEWPIQKLDEISIIL